MKKFLVLALATVGVVSAQAVTLTTTIDLAGLQSISTWSTPGNWRLDMDLDAVFGDHSNYVFTGIAWDVNYTANDPSWLSEAVFSVNSLDGLQYSDTAFFIDQDNPGTASSASGGIIGLDSQYSIYRTSTDGTIAFGPVDTAWLQLYLDFHDSSVSPDGVYNSGFVTLQFEAEPVPEPATMAALGLGVAALLRRRRK